MRPHPDGIRVQPLPAKGRRRWLAGGALLVLALAFFLLRDPAPVEVERREPERPPPAEAHAKRAAAWPAAPARTPQQAPREPPPREEPRPALPAADPEEHAPSAFDLFPDRKRRPYLMGNVVPDDFTLPPGYVRHFQTAHYPDGLRQLPPILLYDFGYQPLDADGRPLPVPEDRVVPPDRLPPGMPIKKLVIPDSEFDADGR